MKIAVIAITSGGKALALGLQKNLDVDVYIPSKIVASKDNLVNPYQSSTKELVEKLFNQYDGLIFIMATGIVVRLISPLIQSKLRDPAVVVIDEKANFAISLLSGHLGGANELTFKVASILGAQPVITTASDVQGKVAFDTLVKKYGLQIENPEALVVANSALVNDRDLIIYSDILYSELDQFQDRVYPLSLFADDEPPTATVIITNKGSVKPKDNLLVLRPRNLVVGIGCRKGVSLEKVQLALKTALDTVDRSINSIRLITSVDIKGQEEALLRLRDKLSVPFKTYDVPTLRKVYEKYPNISYSAFVAEEIGVGCVCETTALTSAREGTMILSKMSLEGVTIAIVEENSGL